MLLSKEKEDFLEIYRDYIGEFDEYYVIYEELVSEETLVYEFTEMLDNIGCDLSYPPMEEDYERINRYII